MDEDSDRNFIIFKKFNSEQLRQTEQHQAKWAKLSKNLFLKLFFSLNCKIFECKNIYCLKMVLKNCNFKSLFNFCKGKFANFQNSLEKLWNKSKQQSITTLGKKCLRIREHVALSMHSWKLFWWIYGIILQITVEKWCMKICIKIDLTYFQMSSLFECEMKMMRFNV